MKKRFLLCMLSGTLIAAVLSFTGCDKLLYSYFDDGSSPVCNYDAEYIQEKYSADECRAEAERLFGMPFEIVKKQNPISGNDVSCYQLHSDSLPFDINVYSEHRADYYLDGSSEPSVVLYAHAYCDYYERMMDYKEEAAQAIAKQYGLDIERIGQSCRLRISGYDQLEKVYDYLETTNELYDFTVVEKYMTNILRDIRNRPSLSLYIDTEKGSEDIVTLYYTINHDTYFYTKDALLPTIQERYIDTIDRVGVKDSEVTDDIRAERCRPALTQLCINGKPVEPKDCGDYLLQPNIVFDYNWLLNDYYGDIRICAPAYDYSLPPSDIGDDRNFKYLVELLGGQYESTMDDSILSSDYYTAQWWLGGNKYSAGAYYQEHIPTISAFSVNDGSIDVDHFYSKEMWGLENGYGPEDYYIRLTPEGLAALLGVTAQADYENGTLDLITPEGYFDFEPPEPAEKVEERFFTEGVLSANGLVKNHTHYVIYKADGSVLVDETTQEDLYADCEQATESIILLRIHGVGSVDNTTVINTDTGEIGTTYNYAVSLGYPYLIYAPDSSGKIFIVNLMTGAQTEVPVKAVESISPYTSAVLSSDRTQLTITYFHGYYDEVTETVDIKLP